MNAILSINDSTYFLIPLETAVEIAKVLANAQMMEYKYSGDDKYASSDKAATVEIILKPDKGVIK